MLNEKNNFISIVVFILIYIFQPVSYQEMRNRNLIDQHKNLVRKNDSRILNPNTKVIIFRKLNFFYQSQDLITSNAELEKKFEVLEEKLSQGYFNSGRAKGFQRWGKSKKICYIGSKGNGARIYYRFVPGQQKVGILAYSNKAKQTSLTTRMVKLYDN